MGQDNAIYKFFIKLSLSKGQNKLQFYLFRKFEYCIVLSH